MAAVPLFGREAEMGVLDDLIDRVGERGAALLLRGEAGVGKSSLLEAERQRVRDRGMPVLTTAGVQSEAHLPFARLLELGQQERTRMSFLSEMVEQGPWSGVTRVASFVEIADRLRVAGETAQATQALLTVALRCWWGNPDQETRDLVVAAAERIPVQADDPALLAILALTDPVKRGAVVIERVARSTPDAGGDPAAMLHVGSAATAVWAHDLSVGFLAAAVDGLRTQGRLGLLAQALVTQAWTGVHLANPAIAMPAAVEAAGLARDTGQPRWAAAAQLAEATMAAERGDTARADSLATEAEQVILPMGANPMLALVQFARGRAALADGRHATAYEDLRRIFDSAEVAYHPTLSASSRGPSARGRSCAPPARRAAAGRPRRGISSPRRSCRSPSSPPRD